MITVKLCKILCFGGLCEVIQSNGPNKQNTQIHIFQTMQLHGWVQNTLIHTVHPKLKYIFLLTHQPDKNILLHLCTVLILPVLIDTNIRFYFLGGKNIRPFMFLWCNQKACELTFMNIDIFMTIYLNEKMSLPWLYHTPATQRVGSSSLPLKLQNKSS